MRSGHRFKTITHLYRFNREEVKVSEAGLHIGCFMQPATLLVFSFIQLHAPLLGLHIPWCAECQEEKQLKMFLVTNLIIWNTLNVTIRIISINPNSHNSQLSSKSNFVFNSQFDLKRPGEGSCPIAAISAPDIYFTAACCKYAATHTTQTGKINYSHY